MAVLQSISRKARELVEAVTAPAAPSVDRLTQLQQMAIDAKAALQAAGEDVELAWLEQAEGAPDRVQAAEDALDGAERNLARAEAALRAHHALIDRRASADAKAARSEAWELADQLARQRAAVADKLAGVLKHAGDLYKELADLSRQTYLAIPGDVRWAGGLQAYRLDVEGLVAMELLRAGLPKAAAISSSMIDQYPHLADVAAEPIEMIRAQRNADRTS